MDMGERSNILGVAVNRTAHFRSVAADSIEVAGRLVAVGIVRHFYRPTPSVVYK